MRSAELDEQEQSSRWAARATLILFSLAWVATMLFSYVWDCGVDCSERFGQALTAVVLSSMVLFSGAALVFAVSIRLRGRLRDKEGLPLRVIDGALFLTSVLCALVMASAFLLAAFAHAGAMERLSLIPWTLTSVISAGVTAVFAAVVGAGSWRVARLATASATDE